MKPPPSTKQGQSNMPFFMVILVALSIIFTYTCSAGVHMIQLVGGLHLEPLVRGSKPSGVGLLLESMVGGWDPIFPIRDHLDAGKDN
jgi:hypothetical protein